MELNFLRKLFKSTYIAHFPHSQNLLKLHNLIIWYTGKPTHFYLENLIVKKVFVRS